MARYRIVFFVLCLALLMSSAGGQAEVTDRQKRSAGEKDSLRKPWIAHDMGHLRLSGGELSVEKFLPVPTEALTGLPVTPPSLFVTEQVRVNSDLLAQDTFAQPETQAEPHIHANPSNPNNLLAGWQENRFSNGGARALGYGASFDGGQTWTEGLLPQMTVAAGGPWEKASDPWVAFGPANRAYFASLMFNQSTPDNAVGISVSTDGGLSWGSPVEVVRSNNGDFNDKETVTVDTFPDSPFFGNVYVTWDVNVARNGSTVAQRLVVARSTDGGVTFEQPVTVRNKGANIGVIPRVAPEGTVYLVWGGGGLRSNTLKLFFSKSTDGGLSWTPKKKLTKIRSTDIPNIRAGEFLPSFDIDPDTGHLYVAWQDKKGSSIDKAKLMVSRDGGANWSQAVRVGDGPDDAPEFTISVAVNRRGEVAVSYYSLRNDPARAFLVDQYVSISRDGGNSFEPAIRVTPASFDVRFAARAGGSFFLGDYVGLTGTDDGFQMLWVAPELPSIRNPAIVQPDVFTAFAQ
ncbi:MAG: glycoside hydrolase [Blastocatellia bacterium]|nr:glycoside hydrolase [Blastocatellia bacterium]